MAGAAAGTIEVEGIPSFAIVERTNEDEKKLILRFNRNTGQTWVLSSSGGSWLPVSEPMPSLVEGGGAPECAYCSYRSNIRRAYA